MTQLTNSQNETETIGAVDALGFPVAVVFDAGTVAAVVSDPSLLLATVSADELSVNVKSLGPVGSATVTVSGSVGGVALTPASLSVDVVAGAPVAISLTLGTPVQN